MKHCASNLEKKSGLDLELLLYVNTEHFLLID
jgi:hypothetical protein